MFAEPDARTVIQAAWERCWYAARGQLNPEAVTTRAALEQVLFAATNMRVCAACELGLDTPAAGDAVMNMLHVPEFGAVMVNIPGQCIRGAVLAAMETALSSFMCDRIELWWAEGALYVQLVVGDAAPPADSVLTVTLHTLRTDTLLTAAPWSHVLFKHTEGWNDDLRACVMAPFLSMRPWKFLALRQFVSEGAEIGPVDLLVQINEAASAPDLLRGLVCPPTLRTDRMGLQPIRATAADLVHTMTHVSHVLSWSSGGTYFSRLGPYMFFVRQVGTFSDFDRVFVPLLTRWLASKRYTIQFSCTATFSYVVLNLGASCRTWGACGVKSIVHEETVASLSDVAAAAVNRPPFTMFAIINYGQPEAEFPAACVSVMTHLVLPVVQAAGGRPHVRLSGTGSTGSLAVQVDLRDVGLITDIFSLSTAVVRYQHSGAGSSRRRGSRKKSSSSKKH